MLSIYSVPEALEFLKAKTGEDWSDSKLFDTVCKLHLTLRAAAPHDAMTEIRVFENGKFAVKDFGGGLLASRMGWRMAVLHPVHVAQVWQTGNTETIHSVGNGGPQGEVEEIHMLGADQVGKKTEHWWFTKPVAVTLDMVRVTPWTLNHILNELYLAPGEARMSIAEQKESVEIDPADLPAELDAANMAFRAVANGYGEPTDTERKKLVDYLEKNYPDFKSDAVQRIATVANPDKSTGRKKTEKE
jgi:hypothetical protein